MLLNTKTDTAFFIRKMNSARDVGEIKLEPALETTWALSIGYSLDIYMEQEDLPYIFERFQELYAEFQRLSNYPKNYRVWWSDGNDRQELTDTLFKGIDGALKARSFSDALQLVLALYVSDHVPYTDLEIDRSQENEITIHYDICLNEGNPHCEEIGTDEPLKELDADDERLEACESCPGVYWIISIEKFKED